MNVTPDPHNCYFQGSRARTEGGANPYPVESDAYGYWDRGYQNPGAYQRGLNALSTGLGEPAPYPNPPQDSDIYPFVAR